MRLCRDPAGEQTYNVADKKKPSDVLVKARRPPFDLHEPSHNAHTPKHSGPINADREGQGDGGEKSDRERRGEERRDGYTKAERERERERH